MGHKELSGTRVWSVAFVVAVLGKHLWLGCTLALSIKRKKKDRDFLLLVIGTCEV